MNVRRLTASLLRLKSHHRTGLTCLLEGVLADTECPLWSKADMALSNVRESGHCVGATAGASWNRM